MILEELDHSCQRSGSNPPIFFFCDRTTRIEQLSEASQIYRVLLKQLLRQSNQPIPERLVEQYQQKLWDGNLDTGVCLELFHEAALSSEQLFVVLDAFDECPQLVRSAILTDLILPLLCNDEGKVKFFVSSRSGAEFETNGKFSIVKSPERTRLIEVQNEEDIRFFIEENVRELEGQDLLGVTEFDEAVAVLRDKADGMYGLSEIIRLLLVLMCPRFRWVQLTLERIKRAPDRIFDILHALPQNLKDTYQALYNDIEEFDRDTFTRTIVIVTYAARSMTVDEVLEALLDDFFEEPQVRPRLQILRICSQFIDHDPWTDQLRLAHLSVREFMEQSDSFPKIVDGHAQMLSYCDQALKPFFDINAPKRRRLWDLGHFISYAITMMPYHLGFVNKWTTHASIWQRFPVEVYERGRFSPLSPYAYRVRSGNLKELPPSSLTPLDVVFRFGLFSIITDPERSPGEKWDFSDPSYARPLKWFCNWHNEVQFDSEKTTLPPALFDVIFDSPMVVEAVLLSSRPLLSKVLQSGAKIERKDGSTSAIHIAVENEEELAVKLLLNNGANARLTNEWGWTALHLSVCRVYRRASAEEITEHLLAHGAEVNRIEPIWNCTPLLLAVGSRVTPSLDLLESLVNAGANLNAKDSSGNTPLHAALNHLYPRSWIVEFLHRCGVDPEATNNLDETPLHCAVNSRYLSRSTFDLLFRSIQESSSAVLSKTKVGATLLHSVTKSLRDEISQSPYFIEKLLEVFDVNVTSNQGEMLLHYAVLGTPDCRQTKAALSRMQILFEKGADVHAKNSKAQTALDVAEELQLKEVAAMLRFYMEPRKTIFGPFKYVPYWYERHKQGDTQL